MKRASLFLLLLASGCPTPLSLECATCASDAECAPQGLTCQTGRCANQTSRCEGSDAGTGGGGGAATGGGGTATGGGGATGGGQGGGGATGGGGVTAMLPALGVAPTQTVLAEDDFEGPNLVGDGGHWDLIERMGQVPGQTLAIVSDAGIAGSRALSISDTANNTPDFGLVAVKNFPEQQGTFFVRSWVRVASTSTPAAVAIAVYSPQVNSTVAAEFSIFNDAMVKGGQLASADECGTTATWDPLTLHLVELTLLDVGASTGRLSLRIDGAAVCSFTRNWSGAGIDTLALGPSYANPAWQGSMQLDAFAMTRDAPPPAKLVVVAPAPLQVGCLPGRVELHDDLDGGLARAVRPVRVDLSVNVFTSADCSGVAVRQLNIATGQPAATFFLQASAGANAFTARDLAADLQSASTQWTVP